MIKKIISIIVISLFICVIFGQLSISALDKDNNNNSPINYFISDETLFDKYMTTLMKFAKKPSITACAISNNSVVWSNGYGLYDIENNKPATINTLYLTASVSKTVTATALMQLYDKGLFNLDDDVNDYLPFELKNPNYPDIPITFRMLLSHRSSLASDNSDILCSSYIPGDPEIPSYPNPWLRNYLTPGGNAYYSSVWSNSKPGDEFYYTNVGFSLIGYLVELISGQNFNEYCKEHIFEPLEMYNTSFRLKDLDIENIAFPYFYEKGNFIPHPHYGMLVIYPSASMRTSVEELSHFLIAHMNKGVYKEFRLLNESTIELMHTNHYPANGNGHEYGLGWNINENIFGKKEIGHSGGWPGVHTLMTFRPKDDIGIIIFTNSLDSNKITRPLEKIAFLLIRNTLYNIKGILAY